MGPKKQLYYHNWATGVSCWDRPPELETDSDNSRSHESEMEGSVQQNESGPVSTGNRASANSQMDDGEFERIITETGNSRNQGLNEGKKRKLERGRCRRSGKHRRWNEEQEVLSGNTAQAKRDNHSLTEFEEFGSESASSQAFESSADQNSLSQTSVVLPVSQLLTFTQPVRSGLFGSETRFKAVIESV